MPRIHLVRHGRAAAGWDTDPNPPLDELGREQALAVARSFSQVPTMEVISSPLLRCQQTAFPLATLWNVEVGIQPAVAEIPSPEGYELSNRVGWLRNAMAGTWSELARESGEKYAHYRNSVVKAVTQLPSDTVVFSHFVAINVIVGEALGNDSMVISHLDNCSITVVDVEADGTITIVEMGREADTLIR